ncbi:ribosomal protein L28 [Culex quinquefasciatus]|uniref:Large ribosomal subunit protein eL28 n=1 Tax=Culex quinquefasciatus TaxID=7176 RepID=B0WN15_CULQU|nr:60S ribosomal protein L28 [Culex quinquefasciatus]XP_038119114.1 60S ribosomal protein L28 [Culex quinquefasciatus]XP_038119115.1 60S ribosomal protein L28 [Culex quinquefasciatus]XP_039429424.1 60S ribosomal protein L28 [Culex pipiens pallens]XP_039429425.1 60S ribosomal protein L28 [Culex pipiens pallens]XP_039429427.1 60S ribosomal protein L28 [Culex pipiens pallens]XP_052566427.1 60S ribosomal protein L28 [Culex pipiens pallens]EDS31426.1 ribosomal protein L28 [Culex quinquefasciatus]|eukprot:XP_001850099.1 ribosomal protein L28 [Culex quinquefasciatus]
MADSSSHLNWLIIRDHNAFLLKRRNIRKPFSTEPNNLTNLSSFRYSGLVHKKSLGIVPADKGISVVYKRPKYQTKPAKATVKVTLKHKPRRALKKLKNIINGNRYRRDLRQAALRRASALLRAQRPAAGAAPAAKKGAKPAAATAAAAGAAAPKKAE